MARPDYYDFLGEARETFGLDYGEARQFWRDFGEVLGFRPDVETLAEYGDLAADLLFPEGEVEEGPFAQWEREVREYDERRHFFQWYDEDWLDEYEEMEVTEYVAYQE